MRALRLLGATAALTIACGTVLIGAAPAYPVSVFVEVNPSTIQAGYAVVIRASCGDPVNPGIVTSDAFGEITLVHHALGGRDALSRVDQGQIGVTQ
jgi:hypothetical protein